MIMCCLATMMTYAQYADCIEVNEFSPTISRWGADYQPVPTELECWEIDLGLQGHAKITYNIDLELFQALDLVKIYEIDANGNAISLQSFSACSATGSLITNSTTGKVKIEYWGFYGNCGGIYNGFQIRVEQATCCDLVNHDHYILGKLGVGTTQPQEMLHVNGAIRGGGTNGEVTLKGDNGSVTIGATDAQTMTFNTDKSMFVFNKPISGNANLGALKIMSSTGYLDLGTMDDDYVRFKTNMSAYHFDKPLCLQSTVIRGTGRALLFYTNTNTQCLTLLDNRVGIGTQNPQYKLDVKGGLYAKYIIADSILHAGQVVVENTIRTQELIVETTGADFVFADDYQLRPLNEVKAFIQENKHLPEIQSAKEMQEDGVSVSELQTKLLQKIEELTLYILQQEERIQALEAELNK